MLIEVIINEGFSVELRGDKIVVSPGFLIPPKLRSFIENNRDVIYQELLEIYPPPPPKGVGAHLLEIIPKVLKSKKCNCTQYAAKLDSWGIEKCEANFDHIVKRLLIRAKRKHLYLPFITKSVAENWLRQAITNAKISSVGILGRRRRE